MISRCTVVALLTFLFAVDSLAAQTREPEAGIVGLWKAKKRFGPDARGPLILEQNGSVYSADMAGLRLPVRAERGELWFELPAGRGGFRGRVQPDGNVVGFWFPPWSGGHGGFATPVRLAPSGANRWQGVVEPFDEMFTLYLLIQAEPDGSLRALLRNPERDWGTFFGIHRVEQNGAMVHLVGRSGNPPRDTTVLTARYDSAQQTIALSIPWRGGTYDFRREVAESEFYPRGLTPARYTYRQPLARADGWPTASIEAVGIARAAVEPLIQHILDMPMDSVNAPQFHALLIARHGKLVLEEYFHGEHRDKLHDTRSGSKSVTATIVGAAMNAGLPLDLSLPVYQVMNGGAVPAGLEPRKRAMTLEHLLSMSSGYFCDDNNNDAPGRENTMWDQEEQPDFYKFTLALPMATAPGEKAVYCSVNPNLALGMTGVALGESPFYLFDRLVAGPLDIRRYAWGLDRARNPYGGGGMQFMPRDYMKFGQLMLDSGTWRGRRILSRDFVRHATKRLYGIGPRDRGYGLAWWPDEVQLGTRVLRRFSALGAGGQTVMVFPELDLVVTTQGGSYGGAGWRYIGGEFITGYVLPAIRN